MTETQPTYDELLAQVAQLQLQQELPLPRGTAKASSGGMSLPTDEALVEARATLSAIIESTSDLIWAVDSEHFGLLMFNHGFYEYFLHDRGMAITLGQPLDELFASPHRIRLRRTSWQPTAAVFWRRRIARGRLRAVAYRQPRAGTALQPRPFGSSVKEAGPAERSSHRSPPCHQPPGGAR